MKRKRSNIAESATGIIRVHSRGFGFLIPDERNLFPVDIFIPRHATKGAIDGDHVEVTLNLHSISEKGPEGRVKKILQRGHSTLAGIVSYISKREIYAYVPLLGEDQAMRVSPPKDKTLAIGDRIMIRVVDWGNKQRESFGEMIAYIGSISDPSCDVAAAIAEFELTANFSENVLNEARAYGNQVSVKEMKNREDLRHLDCITIDPDTAKDFDDALSLFVDESGEFHLGVHIADVSHYVKPGTALDDEASKRCNSVYLPGTVLPMLPHELSSHLCSLKPNVNRLTISVLMVLDGEGNLKNYRTCRSVIKSKKRFTYREAKAVIDGEETNKFEPTLKKMVELCLLLKKKRAARGSIEFALPDLSIELAENGSVKKIELIEYDETHQLVEEFMLLANEVVATHLSKNNKPLTYRVHDEPNPESIRDFAFIASTIGFPLSASPTSEELQNLFDMASKTSFSRFLATSFIRSMKLASYSTENIGHYGLSLEHYTHFTSPIRRYIDLLVHRVLLNESISKESLEMLALRCSEKERLSAKAESSVLLIKKLRYLEEEANQGHENYTGIIVAVKQFGILFEIREILYEGFLPITEQGFAIGDTITVKLKEVDLVTKRTEWTLLSSKKKNMRVKNK